MAKPESIKTAVIAPMGFTATPPQTDENTGLAKKLFPTPSFLTAQSPVFSLNEPYGSGSFQEGNFAFFKPNSDASKKQALFSAAAAGAPTLCSADGVAESNVATSADDLVKVFTKAAGEWVSQYETGEGAMSARFTHLAERVASLFEPIESSLIPPNLSEKIQEVQAALLEDIREFGSGNLLSRKEINDMSYWGSQAGATQNRYSTNLRNFLKRIDDLQTLPARLQQLMKEGRFTAERIIQLIQSGLNTRNTYWIPEDPLKILERAIDSPDIPITSEPEPAPSLPETVIWKLPEQVAGENVEETLFEISRIMAEGHDILSKFPQEITSGYKEGTRLYFFHQNRELSQLIDSIERWTYLLSYPESSLRCGSDGSPISTAKLADRWNKNFELIKEMLQPLLETIHRLKELEKIKRKGGSKQWVDGLINLMNSWVEEDIIYEDAPKSLIYKTNKLLGHAAGHFRDIFQGDKLLESPLLKNMPTEKPPIASSLEEPKPTIEEAASLGEVTKSNPLHSVFKTLKPYLRVAGHVIQVLGATAVYLDFKETEKSFYATEKEEKLIGGALLFETVGVVGILIGAPLLAFGAATIGGGLFLYKDKVTEDRISKDMNEALRAGRFIRPTQDQNFELPYFNELALSSDLDDDGIQKLISKLLSDKDGKKILKDKTVWKKIPQDTLEKIVLLLLDHKAEIKGIDLMPDYVGDDDAAAALLFAAQHSELLLRKVVTGAINGHPIDRSDWNEFETLLQTIGIKADELLPADLAAQMKKESDKNKTFFGKLAGWISP